MWSWLIAGAVGAAWAGKRRPKTRCIKRECFGPRSGVVYQIEEFPDAGFVVVHAPDGVSRATFQRRPEGAFRYVRGEGRDDMLLAIRRDLDFDFQSPPTPRS